MVNLQEMSWVKAKEYFQSSDLVILAVGSTEQHGPQNPLGTDHLIAHKLAQEAAERTSVACLPTIPFGVSSHHRQFWGTVYVKPEVLKAYVRDVCLSLKGYGVRKAVIVNGHGGNTHTLLELARELREQGMFVSIFIWWEISAKCLPEIFSKEERGHAGAEETSLNIALNPDLVDIGNAVDEEPRQPLSEISIGFKCGFDTADYTKSGVFGISTTASAEKGKEIFEAAIQQLVNHVEALKKTKIDDLVPKSLA